jgi:hypothetical protein
MSFQDSDDALISIDFHHLSIRNCIRGVGRADHCGNTLLAGHNRGAGRVPARGADRESAWGRAATIV